MADSPLKAEGSASAHGDGISPRLELLGQLASGVAHDFNNIISATLIHLGLLREAGLSPDQRQSLEAMEREMNRAAVLTRCLREIGRRDKNVVREYLDFKEVIGDSLALLRALIRNEIAADFRPWTGSATICANRAEIEEIVLRLGLAARLAMPEGGTVCFQVNSSSPTSAVLDATFEPGDSQLKCDSTQFARELSEATSIAHGLGGDVETNPDRPWTFRVTFPSRNESPPNLNGPGGHNEVRGGSETILLVEDEPYMCRMSSLSLRKLGYGVLNAGTAAEAIEIWEKHDAGIDLLLTDLLLPGTMNGLELAARLKAGRPMLRVIVSSGQPDELREVELRFGVKCIAKPYTAAVLANVVRDCLDEVR